MQGKDIFIFNRHFIDPPIMHATGATAILHHKPDIQCHVP